MSLVTPQAEAVWACVALVASVASAGNLLPGEEAEPAPDSSKPLARQHALAASWRACCLLYGYASQSLGGGSVETLSWLSRKWERLVASLASAGLAAERDAAVLELCRASLPVWRPQPAAAQSAVRVIQRMGGRPFSSSPILVPTASGRMSSRIARSGGGVLLPCAPVSSGGDAGGAGGWQDRPPPTASDSRLLGTRHVACLRSLLLLAHGTGEALGLGSWVLVCDTARSASQLLAHAGVDLPIVAPRKSVLDRFDGGRDAMDPEDAAAAQSALSSIGKRARDQFKGALSRHCASLGGSLRDQGAPAGCQLSDLDTVATAVAGVAAAVSSQPVGVCARACWALAALAIDSIEGEETELQPSDEGTEGEEIGGKSGFGVVEKRGELGRDGVGRSGGGASSGSPVQDSGWFGGAFNTVAQLAATALTFAGGEEGVADGDSSDPR